MIRFSRADEARRDFGRNLLVADIAARQRGLGQRCELRGADQRHLAALGEIADQRMSVFALDRALGAEHGNTFGP